MLFKSVIPSVMLCLCAFLPKAQNIKFGNVSPQDFNVSKLNVDTSKGAVIISDVGTSNFEGNNKNWFTLVFKCKRRILILNKIAFDLAKVEIPLYISSDGNREENIEKLKGSTYNLVDGQVVETKLSSDAIFKDKYNKNHIIKKFSMPAVKEGSIIEYSYTINSDFLFNLQPWEFQGSYPRVWSEYNVSVPEFFDYVQLSQGFVKYDINEHPTGFASYNIRSSNGGGGLARVDATVTNHHWVIKNVPALTEEKYTSTLNNYIAKIEFQLSGYNFRGEPYENVMGSWKTVGEKLLEDEDFGSGFKKNNNWLDDDMKKITVKTDSKLQKMRAIYYYIKDNIKCTNARGIMLSRPLKDIFRNKSGSVAEVNLLLITMLRHENINADPVILSTRHNGLANGIYPLMNQYNYVVCKASIEDDPYYLDASQPYLGFNHLPAYTYNGVARVITANPEAIEMYADNLPESKITNVILFTDEKNPDKWEGSFKSTLGYEESTNAREKMNSKGKAEYETGLKKGDFKISEIKYEDLDSLEKPLTVNYKLTMGDDSKSDIIYFSPLLMESYTSNPFQSAERRYPVEMPYKIDEAYYLNMEIPAGYEVDEMPKQTRVNLNDGEGFFEYLITKNGDEINMRSRIKLEKATFQQEDYETLRNFYGFIVKKQSEQIVFKKKKQP
ncbi:MAG: DUF3858 domain-containing protein [Ferruginibacter sp.]